MIQTTLPFISRKCNPIAYLRVKHYGKKTIPTLDDVLLVVCAVTNQHASEIKGDDRHKDVVQPRFLAIHFMYEWCKSTNKIIARYLNYDNHSSIIHARQTVADLLSVNDPYMKSNAEKIEAILSIHHIKHVRPVYVSPFKKTTTTT